MLDSLRRDWYSRNAIIYIMNGSAGYREKMKKGWMRKSKRGNGENEKKKEEKVEVGKGMNSLQ